MLIIKPHTISLNQHRKKKNTLQVYLLLVKKQWTCDFISSVSSSKFVVESKKNLKFMCWLKKISKKISKSQHIKKPQVKVSLIHLCL